MPLISVIMPTYKVEEYLPQCIESVMEQNLRDIEIIPVDDGSPDSCGAIIDKYARQDKRIHPIHQKNGGYGKAVNSGLANASGQYIAIVETDDYIEPDMLSTLYNAAEKHHANIVKAGFRKIYSNGETCVVAPPFSFYEPEIEVEPRYSTDLMVSESSIWSTLYKREFLKKHNIHMLESAGASYQDVIFKFMVYSMADTIICVKKPVYNYRVLTANSSSKSAKNWEVQFKNYEVIKQWLIKHNKFSTFKDAFYLHAYFDFIFHMNRLAPEYRKQFIKQAKLLYEEGKSSGIGINNARFSYDKTRDYYGGVVYPFLMILETAIPDGSRDSIPGVQHLRNAVKNYMRRFHQTKAGVRLWNKFNQILHRPFIWNKINEGECCFYNVPNQLQSLDFDNNIFEFDPVTFDDKIALVVLPWYLPNAVVQNIERIVTTMKKRGYKLHLFIYWEHYNPHDVNRNVWDRVFFQHAGNPYFSHTNYSKNRLDADHIDDWIDDDFLQSVVRLYEHYRYSTCIVNYLFYTKAFEVLPTTVRKILYTHDKFARHNQSLHKSGCPDWGYWFGVETEEEEARALRRSNIVLAIQEDDCRYFKKIVKDEVKVITFPFVPSKHQLKFSVANEKRVLNIGYIASPNPPNYFSIKKIIEGLEGSPNIHLYIAGSICGMLKESEASDNITILGHIESLEKFYSSYDIYLNSDTFYSGLKCKTLEALSYGVGIVCTKVAGTGLELREKYHNLNAEIDCVQFILELSNTDYEKRTILVNSMRKESCERYEEFCKKYPIERLTTEMLGDITTGGLR